MFYRLKDNVALRKWKDVDRVIYIKGIQHAFRVNKEEYEILLKCDGKHNLEDSPILEGLLAKDYIEQCDRGNEPSEWSKLKEYDNLFFPNMNLMITGKCNLNCLHCFNAADNAPLNSEWDYGELVRLLDEARDVGVHAFTITGGEPMFHPRFLDIVKAIYERDMFIFELNTNGMLITQKVLDEFKKIGCNPLIKISFDGVGYHNWIRQNPKAEEKTIEAIKLCIQNGFKVKAQTQVHSKNYDVMMDTVRLLDSLGVDETRIIRTTEAPRWEKTSPNTSIPLVEYYDKMMKFAKEYKDSGLKMPIDIWQFMKIFPKEHAYSLIPIACKEKDFNIRSPMCFGTRGMIAISSSGEVVPCLQMSGGLMDRGVSLANVHDKSLKEIITKSDYLTFATATLFNQILNNDKCASCKYYKACTGGCPALGLLFSKAQFDYFNEDITKCYFFENGWYEKVTEAMGDWKIIVPLDIK